MKKKYLLGLMCICTLTICAQTPKNSTDSLGRKQGSWEKQVNGVKLYDGTFKDNHPVGIFTRYTNGKVSSVQDFGNEDSITSIQFYDNKGLLVSKGYYKGRKKTQLWEYYSQDGIVLRRETYADNQLDGAFIEYNGSGAIVDQSIWKQGRMNGIRKIYYTTGELQVLCNYSEGQLDGNYASYYENNKYSVTGTYDHGKKVGLWNYYDSDNGKISRSLKYVNGVAQGGEASDLQKQLDGYEKIHLKDPEKYEKDPNTFINGNQ